MKSSSVMTAEHSCSADIRGYRSDSPEITSRLLPLATPTSSVTLDESSSLSSLPPEDAWTLHPSLGDSWHLHSSLDDFDSILHTEKRRQVSTDKETITHLFTAQRDASRTRAIRSAPTNPGVSREMELKERWLSSLRPRPSTFNMLRGDMIEY